MAAAFLSDRAEARTIRRKSSSEPTARRAPAPERRIDPSASPAPGAHAGEARGDGPLQCLAGGALAVRFHGWRGASGKRYVCSVFPVRYGEDLGGLPEFDGGIALAVGRSIGRATQKIAILDLAWRDGRFAGDRQRVGEALRGGAREWHVHLLAGDSAARRAAIIDIAD